MKTKKIVKNLSLTKETISNLSNLKAVKGGVATINSYCMTWEFNCKACPSTASYCLPCA